MLDGGIAYVPDSQSTSHVLSHVTLYQRTANTIEKEEPRLTFIALFDAFLRSTWPNLDPLLPSSTLFMRTMPSLRCRWLGFPLR